MKLVGNVSLAIIFLILISSLLQDTMAASSAGFCESKCKERCSKAGIAKRCLYHCGVCCSKCNCVPSGTYGNKDECPCYRDLRSDKGTPKCP